MKITQPPDAPTVVDLAAWRDRQSWLAAAEYLTARGWPPCVPCELVDWLRSRGLPAWCQPGREAA